MSISEGSTVKEFASDHARRRARLDLVFNRWKTSRPDAREALQDHPDFAEDESIVLELAYVAYQRRRGAGEDLDLQDYCRQFPEIEGTLQQVLEVDQYFSSNADLLFDDDDPLEWPLPESTVGDFEIVKELGRGAFARVYLARERSLGARLVVLKMSKTDVGEAKTLGRLHHPHIVPIYSVGATDDGCHLLCMPYCGESTIADFLHRKTKNGELISVSALLKDDGDEPKYPVVQLPGVWKSKSDYVEFVLQIGAALASGLAHAHSQGVLHLDLKPSNVLVMPDGRPLLLDFNLAVDNQELQRKLGGTLPYMAPEVLASISSTEDVRRSIDGRADLFGLGVVLYQLLTFRLPFPAGKLDLPFSALAQRQIDQIAAARPLWTEQDRLVGRRAMEVIGRCLKARPSERPASASELADDLRRCLTLDSQVERQFRRKPKRMFAATFTFAVAAIGLAAFLILRPPAYERAYRAGLAELSAGRHQAAVKLFAEAVELRPDHIESLIASAAPTWL
ncbi:MAG: serine/threonine-protein kinase [Pirellulales bacterium]